VARPQLTHAERLRGGLLGVAAGEALGLPWEGVPPRGITRAKLFDEVGPTGAVTAAVLAAAHGTPDKGGQSPFMLATALVLGWRERDPLARRAAALHLGFAPVMVADLAAWAVAGEPLYHLVADHADDWPPPFRGVPGDDRAILDALMAILHRHDDPADGMRAAVRLGGGATARLAALVGGILGSRRPAAVERAPWYERVAVPGEAALDAAIAGLQQK
jgi:hypothetical protein